jgi:hypothetical protein
MCRTHSKGSAWNPSLRTGSFCPLRLAFQPVILIRLHWIRHTVLKLTSKHTNACYVHAYKHIYYMYDVVRVLWTGDVELILDNGFKTSESCQLDALVGLQVRKRQYQSRLCRTFLANFTNSYVLPSSQSISLTCVCVHISIYCGVQTGC